MNMKSARTLFVGAVALYILWFGTLIAWRSYRESGPWRVGSGPWCPRPPRQILSCQRTEARVARLRRAAGCRYHALLQQ